ncbi:hypothetical protein N658DRAFT_562770 [Parathielavia hyrcaniae]|uniref:Uncharacterized protein n=1 Tax=Parathielavia hyrcaniae TaxID=113614 RepID=A0AAN6SW07_9PEZI|nr:hypothetical protein N658DRAFT_562770 [Parathielavia hyrcaniae]
MAWLASGPQSPRSASDRQGNDTPGAQEDGAAPWQVEERDVEAPQARPLAYQEQQPGEVAAEVGTPPPKGPSPPAQTSPPRPSIPGPSNERIIDKLRILWQTRQDPYDLEPVNPASTAFQVVAFGICLALEILESDSGADELHATGQVTLDTLRQKSLREGPPKMKTGKVLPSGSVKGFWLRFEPASNLSQLPPTFRSPSHIH